MAFRIGALPKGPVDLDLPFGIKFTCRPLTTPLWYAAKFAEAQAVVALRNGTEVLDALGIDVAMLPDLNDAKAVAGLGHLIRVQALARAAIIRWSGVFDDKDAPVPLTSESVNALMLVHGIAESFVDQYEARMTAILAEGNASGTSPNGTSATVPITAKGAKSTAAPVPKEKSGSTESAAPTSKTRRRRPKAS